MHYHWGQTAAKQRNAATLNSVVNIKQKSSVACVVSENDTGVIHIDFSESCQLSRDLFGVEIKLKESVFKNNNRISDLFEISHQMFVIMTQNIRCNLNAGVFRTPSSI